MSNYLFNVIHRPLPALEAGPLGLERVHVREQAEPAHLAVEVPADGLPVLGVGLVVARQAHHLVGVSGGHDHDLWGLFCDLFVQSG